MMLKMTFDAKYLSHGTPPDEETAHIRLAQASFDTIVEIGVLKGWTSGLLAKNTKAHVFGIDPLIPDSMNASLQGSLAAIKSNTYGCSNYTFINDYSFNVAPTFTSPIDYLFIDGDHTYEAVKKDFEDWFPKVKAGGYISIHDSAKNRGGPGWWDGPSQLADELIVANTLEYIETVFCLTIFRKRN